MVRIRIQLDQWIQTGFQAGQNRPQQWKISCKKISLEFWRLLQSLNFSLRFENKCTGLFLY
jgi:hypothetical protein